MGYDISWFGQHWIDLPALSAEKIDIWKIGFLAATESLYNSFEILSKELCPQVKKSDFFFVNSISASSHRILMTTIWKSIYFN